MTSSGSDPRKLTAGVLFDVDGTLLDTNFHHVLAWEESFRRAGHTGVDMASIHRLIGRGAEDMVRTLLGHDDEDVVAGHSELYEALRERLEVRPITGAAALVRRCTEAGLTVVLATSGGQNDLDWMLPTLGVDDALSGVVTSSQVEDSKPAPDIFGTACDEHGLDPTRTLAVGDTVWDIEAAGRIDVGCVGMTCGGIGREVLQAAGAVAVYETPAELADSFDESPLAALVR